MDELARLVDLYTARQASAASSKVDVLMDLQRIRDPRVVPFLIQVLVDAHEYEEVRIYVMKQLRNGRGVLFPADRPAVAKAIADVLNVNESSAAELRVQAALALGDFTQ